MKRSTVVFALEAAASLAAVLVAAYVIGALFVAWFTPIGGSR